MEQIKWMGLGYNLPANPSKNRVYVWRKLKDLGAVSFKQGVALLPKSRDNLGHLMGLAIRIREMGGEASLIEIKFLDPNDERDMIRRFREQTEAEYVELLRDCANIWEEIAKNVFGSLDNTEKFRKVVRRYNKVKARDYFKSSQAADTERKINQLKDRLKTGQKTAEHGNKP